MNQPFNAVLLTGGKSSRMGRDKALLEIDGVPLWRRQIETLQALLPNDTFIAGPPRAPWGDTGFTLVADAQENAGPLSGIVGALRVCSAPLLLVLAVDLPQMTADYLRRLLAASSDRMGAVPKSSMGFEPLSAVYPKAALALAEERLRAKFLAMQDFVAAAVAGGFLQELPVRPEDEPLFRNLNRPVDLSALAP